MKKYLEDKQRPKKENEDEAQEKQIVKDGSKWVKTDSECKLIFSFWFAFLFIFIKKMAWDLMWVLCFLIADIVLEI